MLKYSVITSLQWHVLISLVHLIHLNAIGLQWRFWEWARKNYVHITCAHIPGSKNVEADKQSRSVNHDTEWMLCPSFLKQALKMLNVNPTFDLFASRTNKQFPQYFSCRPDPEAIGVHAFSFEWTNATYNAFPPFSIILQTIKKFAIDKTEGVIVVPNWPNQMWFPLIFDMIVSVPILLTSRKLLLTLPGYEEEVCHPLWRKLDVLVCHISGKQYHVKNFQRNLLKSSCRRGEVVPHLLTTNTSKDSLSFVMKGVSLPFRHL